jgi:hypothetical protein
MDDLKRVYWSVDECAWVDCPPPLEELDLPRQRVQEPEPVVATES